jgi:hypothetical protein
LGCNSASAAKKKSTPSKHSATTASVPHQRRLRARKAKTARAIIGGSGMEVSVPCMKSESVTFREGGPPKRARPGQSKMTARIKPTIETIRIKTATEMSLRVVGLNVEPSPSPSGTRKQVSRLVPTAKAAPAPPPAGAGDHLFDHLSVGVHGVLCWSTELREGENRLSTGVYRGTWGSTDTYIT